MQCKKCKGELTAAELAGWLVGGSPPKAAWRCNACDILWLEFTMPEGASLLIAPSDKPHTQTTSEWVKECMAARSTN